MRRLVTNRNSERQICVTPEELYLFRSFYISPVHPTVLTRLVRCLFRGYVPIKCRPVKPKCVDLYGLHMEK